LDLPQYNGITFQEPATPIAEAIIDLHHTIFAILLIISIFVVYMLGALLKKWHWGWEKPNSDSMRSNSEYLKTVNLVHSPVLETVWTIIPSLILMIIAVPSFALLYAMDEVLDPYWTAKVIGYQWYWSYEAGVIHIKDPTYHQGLRGNMWDSYMIPTTDLTEVTGYGSFRLLEADSPLLLPTNEQIRILVTSADVLHAFSVNSLGVKVDAVPGRLNQVAAFIKRPGTFYGQCSELCGTNHAFMPIVVNAFSFDGLMFAPSTTPLDQTTEVGRTLNSDRPEYQGGY